MSTVAPEKHVTAEEFLCLPDAEGRAELVRGKVVEMNPPGFKHGRICARIVYLLSVFLEERHLGRLVGNDAGVVTERGPDTVRGPDVAFYSFARLPQEQDPDGYPDVKPELVFEVLSPGNRWPDVHRKIGEYLDVGVAVVCVLDSDSQKLHLYEAHHGGLELQADDELTLPTVLPDLQIPVSSFFE